MTAEVDFLDPDPDYDLEPTLAALEAAGFDVAAPLWDDPEVDWSSFDLVVIRSTWNYAARREQFLQWTEAVQGQTRLLNPADVIRVNTDKVYLQDLIEAGVPVIPTQVLHPGQTVDWSHPEWAAADAVVVKPTVGAGAIGASRNETREAVEAAVRAHHDVGRAVLVQPYLDAVDTDGEIAIIVLDGEVSHAIKKVPALTVGGHGDPAAAVPVTPELQAVVAQIAQHVPAWDELLYARVDVVPDGQGGYLLMELELTEPALFFTHDPAATDRFVAALRRRLM